MLAIEKLFNELNEQSVRINNESDISEKLQMLERLQKIAAAIEAVGNINNYKDTIAGIPIDDFV